MKVDELKQRMSLSGCVRGRFEVQALFRGKWIKCTSTNTLALDVIKSEERSSFYSVRQAYNSLYRECVNKNIGN